MAAHQCRVTRRDGDHRRVGHARLRARRAGRGAQAGSLMELAPLDHPGRVLRLRAAMADASHEALLLTSLVNIRWTCGFTGSNGWVLITADDLTLFTDGRYTEQAGQELAAAGLDAHVATHT